MKKILLFFVLFILLLNFNSCCKGISPIQKTPIIYFNFNALSHYDLDSMRLYKVDNTSFSVLDSARLYSSQDKLFDYFPINTDDDLNILKQYSYIIKKNETSDTISNLNFTLDHKVHSSLCAGKTDVYTFQLFSLTFKGSIYQDKDSLDIF